MPYIVFLRCCFLCLALCLLDMTASSQIAPQRNPEAKLFIHRIPTPNERAARHSRAKFEPEVGCYLGAFVDFDSSLKLPQMKDLNGRMHRDPSEFEQIVQKPHAMYFFYLGYGRRLPLDWVKWLAQRNKFVHIALEPNEGLLKVKDDKYLQKLADEMKLSGAKIFLRFASEMNGDWTKYYKDPKLYREKFRLIYKVMKQRAPNVALVWCPFQEPTRNIPSYYPGDDATDWVGVNLYNVTYHNNSINDPGEEEHPCDLLRYVYNRYAAKKPIMICEYAASHYGAVEGKPRPDFAMRKILSLYSALPRVLPRIKCINYFDSNNIQFVATRAYNNYSVTDEPLVTAAYRWSISQPYFLSDPRIPVSEPIPMPIKNGEVLKGKVRLSCWARTPSDRVKIVYKVDGTPIYRAERPDLWECIWDAGSVPPGKHTLSLLVYDMKGRLATSQTVSIVTARSTPASPILP